MIEHLYYSHPNDYFKQNNHLLVVVEPHCCAETSEHLSEAWLSFRWHHHGCCSVLLQALQNKPISQHRGENLSVASTSKVQNPSLSVTVWLFLTGPGFNPCSWFCFPRRTLWGWMNRSSPTCWVFLKAPTSPCCQTQILAWPPSLTRWERSIAFWTSVTRMPVQRATQTARRWSRWLGFMSTRWLFRPWLWHMAPSGRTPCRPLPRPRLLRTATSVAPMTLTPARPGSSWTTPSLLVGGRAASVSLYRRAGLLAAGPRRTMRSV